jgi:multidrug resistance efflux pump
MAKGYQRMQAIKSRTLFAMVLMTVSAVAAPGCSRSTAEGKAVNAVTPRQVPVKTIRPKRDPSLIVTVQQPAYVEGFYEADLMVRAAGPVKNLIKDIGQSVEQGELLLEIDVPDRVQDVAYRQALVEQQLADLRVSEDNVVALAASVRTADNTIELEKAQLLAADATMNFRDTEFRRYKVLVERNAVTPDVVDEAYKNYQAAVAANTAARAAVNRAVSSRDETRAKLEMARSDVLLQKSKVIAAQRNRDFAQAQLDLAKVYAPFDGLIVKRVIDPGTFVRDAGGSGGTPVMTLARTKVVTVTSKIPDNYAAFVGHDTDAIVQMDELPGKVLRSKISRFSSFIEGKDRTMRVEVDLFNGSRTDYAHYLGKGLSAYLPMLGSTQALDFSIFLAGAHAIWRPHMKGRLELVPPYPEMIDERPMTRDHFLLPGMYGTMRLLLRQFRNTFLVPSGSVFSRGGKLYIALVIDGKAHFNPVRVQLDDGTLIRLHVITRDADLNRGVQEMHRELTGDEEIILGNQGELTEGHAVKPTETKW